MRIVSVEGAAASGCLPVGEIISHLIKRIELLRFTDETLADRTPKGTLG